MSATRPPRCAVRCQCVDTGALQSLRHRHGSQWSPSHLKPSTCPAPPRPQVDFSALRPAQVVYPCFGGRDTLYSKVGLCKILRDIDPALCYVLPEHRDQVARRMDGAQLWVSKRDANPWQPPMATTHGNHNSSPPMPPTAGEQARREPGGAVRLQLERRRLGPRGRGEVVGRHEPVPPWRRRAGEGKGISEIRPLFTSQPFPPVLLALHVPGDVSCW